MMARSKPESGPEHRKGSRSMRGRSVLVAAAVILAASALAACKEGAAATRQEAVKTGAGAQAGELPPPASAAATPTVPASVPPSVPARSVPPAASAGGLCRRLTFAMVASAVDQHFDIAASSGTASAEQVCVLQRVGRTAPDFTLSVTPTTIDVESFRADYQPKGASEVAGLADAAYSVVAPAEAGAGPRVEVGWLTKKRLYLASYTAPPFTDVPVARRTVPGLLSLARQVTR
jgi:hypothetical protein